MGRIHGALFASECLRTTSFHQGTFHQDQTLDQQLLLIEENNLILAKLGAFTCYHNALRMAALVLDRPPRDVSLDASPELKAALDHLIAVLSLIYLLVIVNHGSDSLILEMGNVIYICTIVTNL